MPASVYPITTAAAGGAVTSVAGRTGVVTLSESDIASLVADLALKAPLASPALTGTPTVPTAAAATSTTQAASTAMVQAAITAQQGAVGGFPLYVRRTGNSSTITSNNTLADDDTLTFSVATSSAVYFVEAYLQFASADSSGAATTADIQVSWTVPTSWTFRHGAIGGTQSAVNSWGVVATGTTPLNLSAGTISFGAAALSNQGVNLAGVFAGDGAHTGSITLRWAQNTSNAATLQILANSFLRYIRLA